MTKNDDEKPEEIPDGVNPDNIDEEWLELITKDRNEEESEEDNADNEGE